MPAVHSNPSFVNSIIRGDCIEVMRQMPANSVDFILTDPPYLVNFRDRYGRSIQNDTNTDWLKPAMAQAYRVLKQDRVAIMFYGWTKVDKFFEAWSGAGFQPIGPLVFRKGYASKSRFLRYQHEQAYLLAKGRPPMPKRPPSDVIDVNYSGNKTPSDTEANISACPLDSHLLAARRNGSRCIYRFRFRLCSSSLDGGASTSASSWPLLLEDFLKTTSS
jgi:hypothetical protein